MYVRQDRHRRGRVSFGPVAAGGQRETVISEETPSGWVLDIRGRRARIYQVEAALDFMSDGAFVPCSVRVSGTAGPVRWNYNEGTGVLHMRVRAGRARILVRPC